MKIRFIIFMVALITIFGCGCTQQDNSINSTPTSSPSDTQHYQEMTIKVLPSPPTIKTTQDRAVIEQTKNLIDGFDKEEIPNTQETGWTMLITFSNGKEYLHCSLLNDTLHYGDKAYRVDGKRFETEITKIFEAL